MEKITDERLRTAHWGYRRSFIWKNYTVPSKDLKNLWNEYMLPELMNLEDLIYPLPEWRLWDRQYLSERMIDVSNSLVKCQELIDSGKIPLAKDFVETFRRFNDEVVKPHLESME